MSPSHPPDPAPPTKPSARAHWTHEFGRRMRHLLGLKTLGITGFMWLFFIGYFQLLRHPVRPVTVMPLTALDDAIALQPSMLGAYVSLWVYVGIPPGLMSGLRDLVVYGLWATALCATGLLCFYLVPTAVPRPVLTVDLTQHPAFAMLQGVDAAGNACPSMHVAGALFTAIWVEHLLRGMSASPAARLLNLAWLLFIVYSTLAIKQHVVYDAVGGALLGLVFALASLRWFPRGLGAAAGAPGGGR